jgi:uncharacterized protein (TIGR00369 family)
MELVSDGTCFACGEDNKHGLHMKFDYDLEACTSTCRWRADERFSGFDGVLHGGIVATLLDEVVANLCYTLGTPVVTAEMKVRYMLPVPTEAELVIKGRLENQKKRIFYGFAEILLPDGTAAAKAEIKFLQTKKPAKSAGEV